MTIRDLPARLPIVTGRAGVNRRRDPGEADQVSLAELPCSPNDSDSSGLLPNPSRPPGLAPARSRNLIVFQADEQLGVNGTVGYAAAAALEDDGSRIEREVYATPVSRAAATSARTASLFRWQCRSLHRCHNLVADRQLGWYSARCYVRGARRFNQRREPGWNRNAGTNVRSATETEATGRDTRQPSLP
ncbi:hypothetical protein VTK56DRAFT_3467 [Thermocarpiscus australiensis]